MKHIRDTRRFQSTWSEPMPPLGKESIELGELEDEPMCVSSRHVEENASNDESSN